MHRTITKFPMADLKPHPRQAALFADLPDAQLRDLADDIKANGLNTPIEILPDGTIVCGHQRTRAATLLGWTEIDCRVRDDLAVLGEEVVEQRLIADNLHRRQLDKLELARCYQRLKELARENRAKGQYGGDLRDVIAEKLGYSGRTLDRHLRVLDAPREIQDAYASGRMSLQQVGRVMAFGPGTQVQVAEQIRRGADPRAVVRELVRREPTRSAAKTLRILLSCLRERVPQLAERMGQINRLDRRDVETLTEARDLIDRLLGRRGS